MAQRLIGYNTNQELRDLTDVVINNPQDFHIVVRQGNVWVNLPIDIINPFILKVRVVTSDFVAESNTIYIVNVKDGPIQCMLPASPIVGDRIIFLDAKSEVPGADCDTGWGVNPFTITANLNQTVLGQPFINKTIDGDSAHLIYSVCDGWATMTPAIRQATEIVAGIARIAKTDEVIAGSSDLLIITPLKLAEALIRHKDDILDTIFPLPDATETVKGISRFSTITEVLDGTLINTGVSPARLQDKFDAYNPDNLTINNKLTATNEVETLLGNFGHINTTSLNVLSAILFPYNVTFTATVDVSNASVVGLRGATDSYSGVTRYSTQLEANTGTDNESAITPLKLKNVIDARLVPASEIVTGISRLATEAEALMFTNNSQVVTPAKVKYILENVTTSNRTLIPSAQEDLLGAISIADQTLVNLGLNDLTAVSPLKLAVRLTALKTELEAYIDTELGNIQLLLDGLQAQIDNLNLRVTALENKQPIRLIDDYAFIQANIGNTVSGSVLANDATGLTVTGYAYLGTIYAAGTTNVAGYGNFSLTSGGVFSYTIVDNSMTDNLNNYAALGTTDTISIQYFVEDNQNQIGSSYLYIKISQRDNPLPTMLQAIDPQSGVEGQDDDIILDLTTYFEDPEGEDLTFFVGFNNNSSKVNVYIDPNQQNNLVINFPIWNNSFATTQAAEVVVGAVDVRGGTVSTKFNIIIQSLESTFTVAYYKSKNLPVEAAYSTELYIYTDLVELNNSIINGPYSTTFEYITNDPPVFKAANSASQKTIDAGVMEAVWRLVKIDATGTGLYLYSPTSEKDDILANPAYSSQYTVEGIAFYAFKQTVNARGVDFDRYQFIDPDPETGGPTGDYGYTVGNSLPAAADYEGVVAKVVLA